LLIDRNQQFSSVRPKYNEKEGSSFVKTRVSKVIYHSDGSATNYVLKVAGLYSDDLILAAKEHYFDGVVGIPHPEEGTYDIYLNFTYGRDSEDDSYFRVIIPYNEFTEANIALILTEIDFYLNLKKNEFEQIAKVVKILRNRQEENNNELYQETI
jgi:hypothetical protein